jgi:hypothetical protein
MYVFHDSRSSCTIKEKALDCPKLIERTSKGNNDTKEMKAIGNTLQYNNNLKVDKTPILLPNHV